MSNRVNHNKTFSNGSTWLKADFHLHTKADKEFKYTREENSFIKDYIYRLKEQNIHIGVISNHNKFDSDEFLNLRKNAEKEEILLLPGVELSVNDGANGIHTIIVFSKQWFENGRDYINQFLNVVFEGKTPNEYEQKNGRTSFNLLETIKKLNGYHRDYFLVFAHVEQRSGLWKEFNGGRFEEIGKDKSFKQKTLAFQKVRTNDCRIKVKNWLKDWYPSEIEGSDCKCIDDIGAKARETWLKVGDFNFEAVKYALSDYSSRVSTGKPQRHKHSYIKNISFEGGILDGQKVNFSSELNTLIGIRGSGKSSILESIRYILDISFGEKTTDITYKNSLVDHTLKSGGKVVVQAVDTHGKEYEIRRILNEQPEVFIDNELAPGISIRETIIHKPIYFGQKDLSSTGEGFEKDLVEKLVGGKLCEIRNKIEDQKQVVILQCEKLNNLSNIDERIAENRNKQQDAEFRLRIFKENGIEEKLKQQTDFNTDSNKIKSSISQLIEFENSITNVINESEDELKNHLLYKSRQNKEFFREFFNEFNVSIRSFDNFKKELEIINIQIKKLKNSEIKFNVLKKEQLDKFAEIRRNLESDLQKQGKQLNLEEFPKLQKTIETTTQLLSSLENESKKSEILRDELVQAIFKLNSLWHDEYKAIESELNKVNKNNSSLHISSVYKGDKNTFLDYFKSIFKGSKIREDSFKGLINTYTDFSSIFNDFNNAKSRISSSGEIFDKYFSENLNELLTWQVPNKFTIEYKGKELKHHSLGQRASALILFVLSQKENDLIIIDQPEDDLDNQTIYNDVIRLIRKLKSEAQFIFATHNANFPVLGDSEQVHSCKYADEKIELSSGSIDSPVIQQEIVDIMEGGEDAFSRRKEIYEIWKPQRY